MSGALQAAHAAVEEHHDPMGSRIGMWLFLFTELLLFGGLFLLYAIYRWSFPRDFQFAAGTLDSLMGGINTLVLLTSSLTMVLSTAALSQGKRRLSAMLLATTIVAGGVFMVNKYFEWSAKFHHDLYPGADELVRHTPGENVFYGIYYLMTGLHGVHVVVGMVVMSVMLVMVVRRPRKRFAVAELPAAPIRLVGGQDNEEIWRHDETDPVAETQVTVVYEKSETADASLLVKLENCGLYWHLVDVIWIFLFPFFYLIS